MKTHKAIATFAIFAATTASAIAAPAACNVDLKPGVTTVSVTGKQVIDICLPAGRKIADLASGDPDGWLISVNKDTGRIMVRIASAGAATETNLIVWSDKSDRYEVKLVQSFAFDTNSASQ